jgi:nitrile hydratase subunit beta
VAESFCFNVLMRINDVGGVQGFGMIDVGGPDEPFHADWEARVFALNTALVRSGAYSLDEFRDAIERMEPKAYLGAGYYERWLHAITTLLLEKGIVPAEAVADG